MIIIALTFYNCNLISAGEGNFHNFVITIHSSRNVEFYPIRPDNITNILADALICCAMQYGERKRYALRRNRAEIATINLSLGAGVCIILENCTEDKYIEFEATSKTEDFTSTRESLDVKDKIPPMHQ